MIRSALCTATGCGLAAMFLVCAVPARGEVRFDEGSWRLELTGLKSLDGDNYCTTGSVEYEFPASAHGKLGLRMYPLFFFGSDDPAYGAGAGVSARVYQKADEYSGLFGEVGVSALWISRDLHHNSSRLNFLSEAGIGYKFPSSGWHVALKAEHISNAGLGSKNSGLDGIGLAAGFTF